jgi:hypothetical protein
MNGQTTWPPLGNSRGRQRAELLAVYGQNLLSLDS